MRKLLVISADLESLGARSGSDLLRTRHETMVRATAGTEMEVIITSPEDAPLHFADAEVVAAFPLRVLDISMLPNIKWIHSFAAGVDKILTPAVIDSEILVSNSSGIHATPIAEHIIGFVLMFTRHSARALRNQGTHTWEPDQSLDELREKTVLIVGLGEIGTETARIAHAFGTRVWAVSRSPKNKPDFVERFGTSDELDAMLPEADFVVITLPHTKETHYLFDAKKFSLMKASAVIINIGRGGLIKEADLIEALREKKIAGAGLDVFEKEPLPTDSPLWDMPNVLITPHHSGLSHRYMDRAVELFCKNLRAYLAGKSLPNLVDKKLGY